jgi:hypothetical protein
MVLAFWKKSEAEKQYTMLLIEAGLVVISIILALLCPNFSNRRFTKLEGVLARFAKRRCVAVLFVGLAAIVARISVLPVLPIAYPGIPDEFGHLLAADTFAHSRLTNPTHPMWVHFENLSTIQRPSYASKYPPAQGAILAVGQVVFGHPFWGVCLSVGLMCAAICWMLQGWLTPELALLGGIIAIVRLGMFSYWANSYWGGAVAALGGALVVGALPRIKAGQRARDALIMAVGLSILANSRPYEGLALSIPVLIALIIGLRGTGIHLRQALIKILLPQLAFLAITFSFMGYYCWRVTGNALRTPYQVSQETYYPTPIFLWQRLPKMPEYNHPLIQQHLEHWELPIYQTGRDHPILMAEARIFFFSLFFLGPLLLAPFLILPFVLPYGFAWKHLSSDSQILLVIAVASLIAGLMPLFFNPGYAAPVTATLYALVLKALRRSRGLTLGQNLTGVSFSRWLLLSCLVLIFVRIGAVPLHLSLYGPRTWSSLDFQLLERARLESRFSHEAGRNLVIVRNRPLYPEVETDWVFNDAEIDNSKVVWAHDMGAQRNAELINYFKDRRVWLAEPDAGPVKVSKYPN